MTIIVLQYQLAVDKFAHLPCRAPEFELQDFFGQILCFIIVNIPHSPIHEIQAKSFIYAFINQVKFQSQLLINARSTTMKTWGLWNLLTLIR
jgi:hypothetical protein